MTAPNPTPNAMPGAQQAPNPQLSEPISTGQAPQPPAPAPAAAPQEEAPQTTPPAKDDKTAEDTTDWKAHARTWEARARENESAKQELEKIEAAKRTKEENDAIAIAAANRRAEQAEANLLRERIARETGVLPTLLSGGTEEEMRASAATALEWRGTAGASEPPKPQTAAVSASTVTSADTMGSAPNGIQQLTKEQFIALSPPERMTAVRAGQCTTLGIGKPQEQRRMGNQLELGAVGGKQ